MIDCFFVGINTISISKQRRMAELIHGKESHEYRDDLNYRFIKYNGKMYTQSQIFEHFYNEDKAAKSKYEFPVFEDTFNSATAYLSSYLVKRGFSIDYINSFNSGKEELKEKLLQNNIRAIAIPTTHYTTSYPITEIISYIKKYNKTAKIILGGPYILNQVRALSEDALERLFNSIGADVYVYSSEGEYTLSMVLDAIKSNGSLENISNVFYKEDKKFILHSQCQEENNLNDNTIDWSLFADKIGKYVSVRTSVSCPFSCGFCTYGGRGNEQKYRYSSIEALEKELDALHALGKVEGIFFSDNTFNVPVKRFKEILRLIIRKKYNFKWQTHFRCQFIDKEIAEMLEESGCVQAFCGLESGSQMILNNMNKKATVEKCKEGIALLNEHNVMTIASFFIGYPGETYETAKESFDFIEDVKPTFYQMRLWWYALNAPIYLDKEKYKLTGSGFNWSHETMNSDYAHNIVDEFYMNIRNSIHIGDTQNVFDMAVKGISQEKIKNFVSMFNECVKERLSNTSSEESSPELIKMLSSAAKCE